MRIGIVSYDFDPPIGGLGVVAKKMRSTMHRMFPSDAHVVFSPSTGADDRVHWLAALRWRKSGGCPLFSLLLIFRLRSLVRAYRLDLLHVHAGSGGVWLLRKPGCPLVVTAHHTYLQEAELVFHRALVKRLWKRLMSKLEARTYDLADLIICVSGDTADVLRERYHQSAEKLIVIENAVEVLQKPLSVRKDDATILFVGRMEERKGIWVVLKAMNHLKSSHPHARLRLVGSNLLGARLGNFIRRHDLTDRISRTGYVFDPLLRRELSQATVLVVPSVLEGFGLIAAEAMLIGTCVVVSDVAGLRSIVKDGETGLVFASGDDHACAQAIGRVLDDAKLRSTLEEAARNDAIRRFNYDDRARDVQLEYQSVLAK